MSASRGFQRGGEVTAGASQDISKPRREGPGAADGGSGEAPLRTRDGRRDSTGRHHILIPRCSEAKGKKELERGMQRVGRAARTTSR